MKTKIKLELPLVFCFTILFLLSCRGKKGEVGPAGLSYDPNRRWTYQEGYIKATVSGKFPDGTDYKYNIDFEGNATHTDNNYKSYATSSLVTIYKYYSGQGEVFNSGDAFLKFSVSDLSTLSLVGSSSIHFYLIKEIDKNKYHEVQGSNNAAISNLSYDSSTGIITGSFSASFNEASGYTGTIVGTFSTTLANVILRVGNVSNSEN